MVEVNIRIADAEPVKTLLVVTGAVVQQWEDMTRCYIGAEENARLADLLDDLTAAVRALTDGERR